MNIHIATYGCQMNKYDSELIVNILENSGIKVSENPERSDAVIINTCSVREHAENRVLSNISTLAGLKTKNPDFKILVAGCMAERLGENLRLINKNIDGVFPPYTYRQLPDFLLGKTRLDTSICDPLESYNDLRPKPNGVSTSFVSIMRGCDNYCSYCIVPYVRGRERSRPPEDIEDESKMLVDQGYHEITYLGQNVNSYYYDGVNFPKLLDRLSNIKDLKRIRFLTSHPKDLSDDLIKVIAERENIASQIHLPLQSGSDKILKLMNRNYTRKSYLKLVENAKKNIDNLFLSTDIISGFPDENESDHMDTIEVIKEVRFESAFTYRYSPREGTKAFSLADNVPEETKIRRLEEIASLQRKISKKLYKSLINTNQSMIVENLSKKSRNEYLGRTEGGVVVVVPENGFKTGDMINVNIIGMSGQTLRGIKV